jgi:hypothetical protein
LLFQVSSSKPSLVGLGKRQKERKWKKGKEIKKKKDFCCQVSLPKMPN